MQKKNVIALVIMIILLVVCAPFAIIAIYDTPSCSDLHGVLASEPSALPGSIKVYYHYYGWPDGISVFVVHQVSGKQLEPGAAGEVWGSSSSGTVGVRSSGSFPGWQREHLFRRVNQTIKIRIAAAGEIRDLGTTPGWEIEVDHQFDSDDAQFAWMVIQGADYQVTSDTVFLIEQQLDGSSTVKKLDFDLPEFLGESEDGNPRRRGIPDKTQLETFLLESPVLEELMKVNDQGQKRG